MAMTDREISVPFRLDNQGRVATVTDPNLIARQHLTTFLLTRPTERVMRPRHGTGVKSYLFENLDPLQMELLATRTQEVVGELVRDVRLRSITATDSDDATVTLTVEFALAVGANEGTVMSTSIVLGGAGA